MAKTNRAFKRVLLMSDIHCGHLLGLTPPSKHFKSGPLSEIQNVGWRFYTETVKNLKPIDIVIVNADCIDGPGRKDSTEHLTTNMNEQVKMAQEIISFTDCKKIVMTRGSGYHVSVNTEIEDQIAAHFGCYIADYMKLNINGLIIHAQHHTGKGGTAYGSATSGQRSAVVTILNDVVADNEQADVFIRSHVHEYIETKRTVFHEIITPALQLKAGGETSSTYGRRCTGFYDYGLVHMDITDKNNYTTKSHILKLSTGQREEVIKL